MTTIDLLLSLAELQQAARDHLWLGTIYTAAYFPVEGRVEYV